MVDNIGLSRIPVVAHEDLISTSYSKVEGWQSGNKLEFYPSGPGSTPARVKYHKK